MKLASHIISSVILLMTLSFLMFVCTCSYARAESTVKAAKQGNTSKTAKADGRDGTGKDANLDVLRQSERAIVNLVDRLSPQVVAITVGRVVKFPKSRRDRAAETKPYEAIMIPVRGSGCIISRNGEILTNEHLIHQAKIIRVTLWNGKEYEAKLVGADVRSDLAVIRIVDRIELTECEFGDLKDVRRGQFVLAMGNPLGLAFDGQSAVSFGIISAIGRHVTDVDKQEDRYYGNLIQTTAQINVGNSGSPLFNLDGKVIGINTIISSTSVSGSHLGFAIPISRWTKRIIAKLRKGEKIEYGYLGVLLADIPGREGAIIEKVVRDSPAGRAGLKPKDIIVEYNGQKIVNVDELIMLIGLSRPGTDAKIRTIRNGKMMTLSVRIASRKDYIK